MSSDHRQEGDDVYMVIHIVRVVHREEKRRSLVTTGRKVMLYVWSYI